MPKPIEPKRLSEATHSNAAYFEDIRTLLNDIKRILENPSARESEIFLAIRNLDYLWSLCYKTKRNRHINKRERDISKRLQPFIHGLYFDLLAKAKMRFPEKSLSLPPFERPETSDAELAALFTDMGISNTLVEEVYPPNHQEEKAIATQIKTRDQNLKGSSLPPFERPETSDAELHRLLRSINIPSLLIER